MKKIFSIVMAVALILTLGLGGIGCALSGQQPSPSSSAAGTGTVEVHITDAPPEEQVTSILMTVSKIEIHKAGGGEQEQEQEQAQEQLQVKGNGKQTNGKQANDKQTNGKQNAVGGQKGAGEQLQTQEQEQEQKQVKEQNGGSWISIDITAPTTFDLLKIKGVEQFFGTSQVEAGRYTQIRLTVDKVEVGLNGEPAKEVKLPSGELKLVRPFEVKDGETTVILIDFDADKSIHFTGSGTVIVKPTVKLDIRQKGSQQPQEVQFTQEDSRLLAENFLKQDDTFAFDGIADTLNLTKTEEVGETSWAFTFEFDSSQAGYGDRTGQTLAQVITHHVAVIAVENGNVQSAVMDEKWDMLKEKETLNSQIKDAHKVSIDASYDGKEVELAVGDVLVVTLESNMTTGFSWKLKGISDEAVLENIGNKYNAPGQGNAAGQGGQEVWYFKTLAAGKSTITLEYRRPWEQGVAAEKTFTVTANVK